MSYCKVTGIAIHYKDVSLRWENKKNLTKINSTFFQAGFLRNCELRLGTYSWIVSQLDCRWNLECFFSVLDPENCKEIGKIGEIVFGGLRTKKNIREND